MTSALSIDPANLASQYTQIERQAKDQILSTQYAKYNNQIKAFTQLKNDLSDFFDALEDYQDPDTGLLTNTASVSSETNMNVTASADAVSGDYDIFVEQLAQAHQIALSFDPSQPLSTDGELAVSLGTDSFSVDLAGLPAGATLTDLASAINNHADNSGVKATLMRSGSETFLVLTSEESGAANTVSTTFTACVSISFDEVLPQDAKKAKLNNPITYFILILFLVLHFGFSLFLILFLLVLLNLLTCFYLFFIFLLK